MKSIFNSLLLVLPHFSLLHPALPVLFLHSLFPYLSCYLGELTLDTLGSFRMEGSPYRGGGFIAAGRRRRTRTTHSPAQRALCAHPQVCNTSTLLSLRHSLSLELLPILPTDTFMYIHTHTHINTHLTVAPLFFIVGRDHSFFPGRRNMS